MALQLVVTGGNGYTFASERQDGDYIFLYTYRWRSISTRFWNNAGWTMIKEYSATSNDACELWYLRWHPGLTFSTSISWSSSSYTGQSSPAMYMALVRGLTATPTLASDIWENGASGDIYCPAVVDETITPGDIGLICSHVKGGPGVDWNSPSEPLPIGWGISEFSTANWEEFFGAVNCDFSYSPAVSFPNYPRTNAFTMQVILPGVDQTAPTVTTTGGVWWKWKAPRDGVLSVDSLYSDPWDRNGTTYLFVFKGDDAGGGLELVARYVYPQTAEGLVFTTGIATLVNTAVKAGQTYYIKATSDPTGAT